MDVEVTTKAGRKFIMRGLQHLVIQEAAYSVDLKDEVRDVALEDKLATEEELVDASYLVLKSSPPSNGAR